MLFLGSCNIAPVFCVFPDRRELPFGALGDIFWLFSFGRTFYGYFCQSVLLASSISYIQDRKGADASCSAFVPFLGIPDNAISQVWVYDYTKGKVQVFCAAFYTLDLSLAESSYLKDFYPKAPYAAPLPLSHSA